MALSCAIQTAQLATTAGGQPVTFNLAVYNPNAVAVSVTGVQIVVAPAGSSLAVSAGSSSLMNQIVAPIGPGQTTVVPALSSITIGPMYLDLPSSNSNTAAFMGVPFPGQQWQNTNPALPGTLVLAINALVSASDGSFNMASPGGLTVSSYFPPPAGTQGGNLQFGLGANFGNFLTLGL